MAPHQQQISFELIAQLDNLFKGASFPEVGTSDGPSHFSHQLYFLVEDLTALPPKLTLYEGMCVGCAHIVPDVDQISEPLFLDISTAALVAWAVISEPSAASNIFFGKRFIFASLPLLQSDGA
jgi:hypothetical protein